LTKVLYVVLYVSAVINLSRNSVPLRSYGGVQCYNDYCVRYVVSTRDDVTKLNT